METRSGHDRRKPLDSGESCCAEVVRASTTIKVVGGVVAGVISILLVVIPLFNAKITGIEASMKAVELQVAKMAAAQDFLAFRMTEHLTETRAK